MSFITLAQSNMADKVAKNTRCGQSKYRVTIIIDKLLLITLHTYSEIGWQRVSEHNYVSLRPKWPFMSIILVINTLVIQDHAPNVTHSYVF